MLISDGLDSHFSWRACSEIMTPYSEWSSGLSLCKMSVEVLFEKLTQLGLSLGIGIWVTSSPSGVKTPNLRA